MTRVSNCRNFKCPSNEGGDCNEDHIELVPIGGRIDRLICVQATEPEEPTEPETAKPNGTPPVQGG